MNNPERSQAEKRKTLAEDRDRMASYLDHARASADDDRGGRFAAVNKTTVTGTSSIHQYPKQPETSPSNQLALMPDEPLIDGRSEGLTLGYEIDRPDAPAAPEPSGRRGWRRL
jgi:hypothetical protein